MEGTIREKWSMLDKYLPFVDYLLELDRREHFKFERIKKWILQKERYNAQILENIYKAILTQYRNLCFTNHKLPPHLLELFVTSYDYVEISSDDEEAQPVHGNAAPSTAQKDSEPTTAPAVVAEGPPNAKQKESEPDRSPEAVQNSESDELAIIAENLKTLDDVKLRTVLEQLLRICTNTLEKQNKVSESVSTDSKTTTETESTSTQSTTTERTMTTEATTAAATTATIPNKASATEQQATASLSQTPSALDSHSSNPVPLNIFNGKLNLNDPRIVKQLKMIKNSPIYSVAAQQKAANLCECIPHTTSTSQGETQNQIPQFPNNANPRSSSLNPSVAPQVSTPQINNMRHPAEINQKRPNGITNRRHTSSVNYQAVSYSAAVTNAEVQNSLVTDKTPNQLRKSPTAHVREPLANGQISKNPQAIVPTNRRLSTSATHEGQQAAQYSQKSTEVAGSVKSTPISNPTHNLVHKGTVKSGTSASSSTSNKKVAATSNVVATDRAGIQNKRETFKKLLLSTMQPHKNDIETALRTKEPRASSTSAIANEASPNSHPSKTANSENERPQAADTKKKRSRNHDLQQFVAKDLVIAQILAQPSINGKRRCSISARSAIAEQLGSHKEQRCETNVQTAAAPIGRKRRSSLSARLRIEQIFEDEGIMDQESDEGAKKICKRRFSTGGAKARKEQYIETAATIADKSKFTKHVEHTKRSQTPTQMQKPIESRNEVIQRWKQKHWNYRHINLNPVVKIRRLTRPDIEKYRKLAKKKKETQHSLFPMLNIMKSLDESLINSKLPRDNLNPLSQHKRNTDKSMTERNALFCTLCRVRSSNLTSHYVRFHKTESYVSRLSDDTLTELHKNIPFSLPIYEGDQLKYKMKCIFCNQTVTDHFLNFHNHISMHTGEFAFQCSRCKLQKPYANDIKLHSSHAKLCQSAQLKVLYQYPKELMTIYLYACRLCNFVQMNEANVYKHLRDHHDKLYKDTVYVKKYILVAMSDSGRARLKSSCNTCPKIQNTPITYKAIGTLIDKTTTDKSHKPDNYKSPDDDASKAVVPMTVIHSDLQQMRIVHEHAVHNNTDEIQMDIKYPIDDLIERESSTTPNQVSNSNCIDQTYRAFIPGTAYFGLFKCMADDCYFSTDVKEQMLEHLNEHSSSAFPPKGYLNCAYCQVDVSTSPETLIEHVESKHSASYYQCQLCCYRSGEPCNVLIHMDECHQMSDLDICIYKCSPLNGSTVKERNDETLSLIRSNVEKLKCKYCKFSCYTVSAFENHFSTHHPNLEKMHFKYYVCIYCGKNIKNNDNVKRHLALKHPDESPQACVRSLKSKNVAEVVENLKVKNMATEVPIERIKTAACESEKAPEKVETEEKPTLPQLFEIQLDVVRPLLRKLTAHTGIPIDRLYQCPVPTCGGIFSVYELWARHQTTRHNALIANCPHCSTIDLSVTEFQQHFYEHSRHTYLCYYCEATFRKELELCDHAKCHEALITESEIVKIPFNLKFAYYVLVDKMQQENLLEFYTSFTSILKLRWQQWQQNESQKMKKQWPLPLDSPFKEGLPTYCPDFSLKEKRCFLPRCNVVKKSLLELLRHARESHTLNTSTYECYRCGIELTRCTWASIENHIRMHDGNLYVCSICNHYHYDRNVLSTHIRHEHNKRDVPVITLVRTPETFSFALHIVFASDNFSFTTINRCIFCKKKNLNPNTYALHLKNAHNMKLDYVCELCHEPIVALSDAHKHFENVHKGYTMKIRCEIGCNDKIVVKKVDPIELSIERNKLYLLSENTIKEEVKGDADELELIVLEEDDIAIANKYQGNTQNKANEAIKIRCTNICDLLDSNPQVYLLRAEPAKPPEPAVTSNVTIEPQKMEQQTIAISTSTCTPTVESTRPSVVHSTSRDISTRRISYYPNATNAVTYSNCNSPALAVNSTTSATASNNPPNDNARHAYVATNYLGSALCSANVQRQPHIQQRFPTPRMPRAPTIGAAQYTPNYSNYRAPSNYRMHMPPTARPVIHTSVTACNATSYMASRSLQQIHPIPTIVTRAPRYNLPSDPTMYRYIRTGHRMPASSMSTGPAQQIPAPATPTSSAIPNLNTGRVFLYQ